MSSLPLHDAIRQFLEYCEVERGRSPGTVAMYQFVLNRFAAFANKRRVRETAEITLEFIRVFRLWLHRRPGRKGETLSRTSQNLHLTVLRSFLKFLAKRDVDSLPPEKIELAKQEDREVAFLEPEEVERLLAAPLRGVDGARTDSKAKAETRLVQRRDAAILELLFSTGMRVGELVRLTRDDVNLKRDEFAIRGKGGKIRIVFLSASAKLALQQYLRARRDPSPALFVRHDRAARRGARAQEKRSMREQEDPKGAGATALTARSVERLVGKYARAAGIVKPVHPHMLRHSYATDLLRGGAQLRDVQAMLGHASITTTQIYTHVTEQHLREVHARHHRTKKLKRTLRTEEHGEEGLRPTPCD